MVTKILVPCLVLVIIVLAGSAIAFDSGFGLLHDDGLVQVGLNSGGGQPNYLSNPLIDKFFSEHYGGMKFDNRRERFRSFRDRRWRFFTIGVPRWSLRL